MPESGPVLLTLSITCFCMEKPQSLCQSEIKQVMNQSWSKCCPEGWGESLLFPPALLQIGQWPICALCLAVSTGCQRGVSQMSCSSPAQACGQHWFPSLNASPPPCSGEKVNHTFQEAQGWVLVSEGQLGTGSLGCYCLLLCSWEGGLNNFPDPKSFSHALRLTVPICFL